MILCQRQSKGQQDQEMKQYFRGQAGSKADHRSCFGECVDLLADITSGDLLPEVQTCAALGLYHVHPLRSWQRRGFCNAYHEGASLTARGCISWQLKGGHIVS